MADKDRRTVWEIVDTIDRESSLIANSSSSISSQSVLICKMVLLPIAIFVSSLFRFRIYDAVHRAMLEFVTIAKLYEKAFGNQSGPESIKNSFNKR